MKRRMPTAVLGVRLELNQDWGGPRRAGGGQTVHAFPIDAPRPPCDHCREDGLPYRALFHVVVVGGRARDLCARHAAAWLDAAARLRQSLISVPVAH